MSDFVSKEILYNLCQPSGVCRLHVSMIDQMPAADVRPVVRGRWLKEENIFDDSTYVCSACNEPWTIIEGTPKENNMNFCPNCGADMREEKP